MRTGINSLAKKRLRGTLRCYREPRHETEIFLSLRFKKMRAFAGMSILLFYSIPRSLVYTTTSWQFILGEMSQKSTHHCRTVMKTQRTTFRYGFIFSDAGRNLPRLVLGSRRH